MKKLRNLLKNNAAFTLVELIVVIAVLGILAGIAVPRLTGVQDKADIATAESALSNIKNYSNMYFSEYGTSTTPALNVIVEEYSDQSIDDIIPDGWSLATGDVTSTSGAVESTNTIILQNDNDNAKTVELDLSTGNITD